MVKLIALLPKTTYFYLNLWTWGYEDVLIAISKAFQCQVCTFVFMIHITQCLQIHVDTYKYDIFQSLQDKLLRDITTTDTITRFHCCERFARCAYVDVKQSSRRDHSNTISEMGKHVVYVNPVSMEGSKWSEYLSEMEVRIRAKERISHLVIYRIVSNVEY